MREVGGFKPTCLDLGQCLEQRLKETYPIINYGNLEVVGLWDFYPLQLPLFLRSLQ